MRVAVIGAGPAGLAAAEVLAARGAQVGVFDRMPSAGRKFLLAGRGGLNLTHSEPREAFLARLRPPSAALREAVRAFDGPALRGWAAGLGVETFVGTSGRVFPTGMKAAPLLRAWLHRLRAQGVAFHMRHRWAGWDAAGRLRLCGPDGVEVTHGADATVLALGGASWPRLGSDGSWQALLAERGVAVSALLPANCGFDVAGGWSQHFASRFAGQPFKSVAATVEGVSRQGEFVATATGIEGSLVYAFSAVLRDRIAAQGQATLELNLLPALSPQRVLREVAHPRGSRSLSSHLKGRLGLDGIKLALLHELLDRPALNDPQVLARAIQALPLALAAPRPVDEAISSAGGVRFEAMDEHLMLRSLPGVFCAGEMLDWEAPTGGYLLTASMATGVRAGHGAADFLALAAAPPGSGAVGGDPA
jgi:uncharacterized flavoprotein (TIGR03862 family)